MTHVTEEELQKRKESPPVLLFPPREAGLRSRDALLHPPITEYTENLLFIRSLIKFDQLPYTQVYEFSETPPLAHAH